MAYELFLGRLPFIADNPADLICMHLREPPPPPRSAWPDVPPAIDRLLTSMLAKAPADRPGIDEVRAVLEAARGTFNADERVRARGTRPPPAVPGEGLDVTPTWDMPARSRSRVGDPARERTALASPCPA